MIQRNYYYFNTREVNARERNFDIRPSAFKQAEAVVKPVHPRERIAGMEFYSRLLNAGWERVDAKHFVLRMFDMQ